MQHFLNSFDFEGHKYYYYDLQKLFLESPKLKKLPISLKILLESNLRNNSLTQRDLISIFSLRNSFKQIKLYPSRVLMNDEFGIMALMDFLLIKKSLNKDFDLALACDLIIENYLNKNIFKDKSFLEQEEKKNIEKYKLAKLAKIEFKNLSIIPPCDNYNSQVNLEYLATLISLEEKAGLKYLFPESLVGTDNHCNITNTLGVFSYQTSLINSQKALFDGFVNIDFPEVIGIELSGSLAQGLSIIDLVLNLSLILKEKKIKGKILEFYGEGLKYISPEDRVSFSLMASKFEALCSYFPLDESAISFVEQTRGVDASIIKEYYKKQTLFANEQKLEYDEEISFNLSSLKALIAGPKKIEDKLFLEQVPEKLESFKKGNFVKDNDIVLANIGSIDSLNPSSLIQATLLAKKAQSFGLKINENIKKSFCYISLSVKKYLEELDLLKYLENYGFDLVASSCKTNFNKTLHERVELDIEKFNLNVCFLSSSSSCFDEDSFSLVKSSYLMSPSLVLAYCLRGNMDFDISKDEIEQNVYLRDIWPSMSEVNDYLEKIDYTIFKELYEDIFKGNNLWQNTLIDEKSFENFEYLKPLAFKKEMIKKSIEIKEANILTLFEDNVLSKYLSSQEQIPLYSQGANYLKANNIPPSEYNSFLFRKEDYELIKRSSLSNINLKNLIVYPKEGGFTKDFESSEIMSIYEYSKKMQDKNKALVLFAGKNFPLGKLDIWTARLFVFLGVKAIIAESFSKEFKNELLFYGVLPLEFIDEDIKSLNLKGNELISIKSLELNFNSKVELVINKNDLSIRVFAKNLIENENQLRDYKYGGFFSYLLNEF